MGGKAGLAYWFVVCVGIVGLICSLWGAVSARAEERNPPSAPPVPITQWNRATGWVSAPSVQAPPQVRQPSAPVTQWTRPAPSLPQGLTLPLAPRLPPAVNAAGVQQQLWQLQVAQSARLQPILLHARLSPSVDPARVNMAVQNLMLAQLSQQVRLVNVAQQTMALQLRQAQRLDPQTQLLVRIAAQQAYGDYMSFVLQRDFSYGMRVLMSVASVGLYPRVNSGLKAFFTVLNIKPLSDFFTFRGIYSNLRSNPVNYGGLFRGVGGYILGKTFFREPNSDLVSQGFRRDFSMAYSANGVTYATQGTVALTPRFPGGAGRLFGQADMFHQTVQTRTIITTGPPPVPPRLPSNPPVINPPTTNPRIYTPPVYNPPIYNPPIYNPPINSP